MNKLCQLITLSLFNICRQPHSSQVPNKEIIDISHAARSSQHTVPLIPVGSSIAAKKKIFINEQASSSQYTVPLIPVGGPIAAQLRSVSKRNHAAPSPQQTVPLIPVVSSTAVQKRNVINEQTTSFSIHCPFNTCGRPNSWPTEKWLQ